MKHIFTSILLFCCAIVASAQTSVAIYGNSYITSAVENETARFSRQGFLQNWSNEKSVISTYFKLHSTGELSVAIRMKNDGKPSNIKVTVANKTFYVNGFKSTGFTDVPLGVVNIADTGYVAIQLQGVSTENSTFATVQGYIIAGAATKNGVVHCGTFEPYWTLRGPSVHLKYRLPNGAKIRRFYNEVTVREGNDPLGSYYMANGFGEGYCGIQVNSATERRILFSVWSPFVTDDPKSIPDSLKIILLKKGENTVTGEFGNEGSGGQSFIRYNWITGNTYKFLTEIEPDGKGNTIYTAYFYAPESGRWQLIASFLRPKTETHYTNAHSFLENFWTDHGHITRQVEFGNQWAQTADGEWIELTEAIFTFDETARAGVRKDYAGGVAEDGNFFLKNCGFFNNSTPFRSTFTRKPTNKKPEVNI